MKSNKADNIDIIITRNGEHSQPQKKHLQHREANGFALLFFRSVNHPEVILSGRRINDNMGVFEPQMATKQGIRYWRL